MLVGVSAASEPLWPDLSEPPRVGGGSKDAAVVVAIEDYVFVSDIPGAESNGLDWYAYLTDGRGLSPGRVKLLENERATKEEIEQAVSVARAKVEPGGTLWFVFIGHGAPSADGSDGILLGVDTQQTATSVYARGLPQSALLSSLSGGAQSDTVVVLDACFSGQGQSGAALVDGLQPLIPTYAMSSGRTTVLSAGQGNEFAGPLPGLGRPAFSYLALGALRGWGDEDGNGVVTASEVATYAEGALSALPLGRSQTPQHSGPDSALGRGREAGPSLSQIRRGLSGASSTASPSVEVGVEVGADDLSATLAALNQIQAEEDARAAEKARLQERLNAELDEKSASLQSEARRFWSQVTPLAERGEESGRQALQAFISKYDGAAVTVGNERRSVEIPEVAEAQTWLARYDSGSRGDVWVGESGYEMVWVEPGRFTMGSPSSEPGRYDDEVQHRVELTEGFYVGTLEVTQGLWSSVMGSPPASGQELKGYSLSSSDYPVVYISWCDAVLFANALSLRDGLTPAYRLPSGFSSSMVDDACNSKSGSVSWDRSADGYRLLTESEWEYAARAGSAHRYAGTSRDSEMCRYGNVFNPSSKSAFGFDWESFSCEDGHAALAPVGSFEANAWGLYDMSGNVWEWCWDWYGEYPQDASVDPSGPRSGSYRVLRGGSWRNRPAGLRTADRSGDNPDYDSNFLGLRLSRS